MKNLIVNSALKLPHRHVPVVLWKNAHEFLLLSKQDFFYCPRSSVANKRQIKFMLCHENIRSPCEAFVQDNAMRDIGFVKKRCFRFCFTIWINLMPVLWYLNFNEKFSGFYWIWADTDSLRLHKYCMHNRTKLRLFAYILHKFCNHFRSFTLYFAVQAYYCNAYRIFPALSGIWCLYLSSLPGQGKIIIAVPPLLGVGLVEAVCCPSVMMNDCLYNRKEVRPA